MCSKCYIFRFSNVLRASYLQVLNDWLKDVKKSLQSLNSHFRIVYIYITCKKIIQSGLQYALDTDDLLVVPRQTLAAYLPAIADRLVLLNENLG